MKKLLFSLLAVMLSVSMYAQGISGGLKAGVNLASQKYSNGGSETYNGTSFHIGAYANFGLSDAISIQPELLYNSLKFGTEDDLGEDFTTNYLSIPVMFVYGFADNKFNIQAGPQLGFLLSTDPSELKDVDWYKGTDFTLNIGAGANFGKVNLTARYGFGLSNIAGDLWEDLDLNIKNSNFQISVGIRLFGE